MTIDRGAHPKKSQPPRQGAFVGFAAGGATAAVAAAGVALSDFECMLFELVEVVPAAAAIGLRGEAPAFVAAVAAVEGEDDGHLLSRGDVAAVSIVGCCGDEASAVVPLLLLSAPLLPLLPLLLCARFSSTGAPAAGDFESALLSDASEVDALACTTHVK